MVTIRLDNERLASNLMNSAAVVFWETFLTLPVGHHPTLQQYPNTKTFVHGSIHQLPTELLGIIFKLVFTESCLDPEHRSRGLYSKEILSPSLFPYAVASVCSQWRDIITTVPIFWTYFIVLVNSDTSLFPLVKHLLDSSHNLPLRIAAVDQLDGLDGDGDKRRRSSDTNGLLELLRPYVQRSKSVTLYTISPVYGIISCSPEPDFEYSDYDQQQLPLYSRLYSFIADGRSHHSSLELNPGWRQIISGLNDITLSYLESSDCDGGIQIRELFTAVQNLPVFTFTLQDIVFDSILDSPVDRPIDADFSTITFINMKHDVLRTFFFQINPRFIYGVTFIRCSLTSLTNLWDFDFIMFQDISEAEDLSVPLRDWTGQRLSIFDCPGFNDDVLAMLGRGEMSSNGVQFGCPKLTELFIVNCGSFSVGAMKNMVEARCGGVTMQDDDDRNNTYSPAIHSITVHGYKASLSVGDTDWFHARVASFNWYS